MSALGRMRWLGVVTLLAATQAVTLVGACALLRSRRPHGRDGLAPWTTANRSGLHPRT